MTEQTKTQSKKRGPKPIGEAPMTPAERQRRRREQMRAHGAKDFVMTVGPSHLVWVERLAETQQISTAAALHVIVENALDFYRTLMVSRDLMALQGVPMEECTQFVFDHWPLQPPKKCEELLQALNAE